MINYYFGLPGSGKTTHLVSVAIRENKLINKGRSKFKRILSNVRFSLPAGVESHCYYFDNDDFGKFDMSDSLILFDESQMMFDNREYKSMTTERRNFLMLHRHYRTCICFYNQTYDGIDKKIRCITNNVYYLRKNIFTGRTVARRIKFAMYIPKKPRRGEIVTQCENGEITYRYYKSGLLEHLISRLFIHPPIRLSKYYRYFDSYEAPALPVKEFELL